MPETVDAKKLSAANPICIYKYLFLFRIMNYMHIPTENRLNPFLQMNCLSDETYFCR